MSGTDGQIAIVGMAALLPGAGDLEAYWQNLVGGVDAITEAPAHRWDRLFYDPDQAHRPDRLYCRRGGFVDENAGFEPLKFGIMPNSVGDIEPDQLIALEIAAAAIEDAGGQDRLPDGDRVGVIIGRGGILSPAQARYAQRVRLPSQVAEVLRELVPDLGPAQLDLVRQKFDQSLGPHQPEGTIGLVPNLAASRIANRLNLRGPAYTVDAACASSLIAVDQGMAELNRHRLDVVLAGGVHHVHDISFWSVFSQLRALSRQGEIRPFDSSADGLLIGEGTGIVVLKRLADAVRDGDRIHSVIVGSGVSSDGRSASMFNPASSGQVLAMRQAWREAGLDPTAPDALGMLEAHGTATPTGDSVELASIAEVFGPHRAGTDRVTVGSVKSMIGHAMPAAGIAGLIKATLAVSRGMLLPTLHCERPRPELERTRFAPIAAAAPWPVALPRRAAVNAFGFGGINAHLIIESPAPAARSGRARPPAAGPGTRPPAAVAAVAEPDRVLWLAAPDPTSLARMLDADDQRLRDLGSARAGAGGSAADERCRIGVVDPTDRRLATARQAVARGRAWRGGRDVWYTPQPLLAGDAASRVAFVFPGIEAEFTPRVDDVAAHFGLADREWSADDLGRHGAGVIEVGKLLDAALRRIGVVPDAVAGHSLGEWAAAATTGLMSTASMDEFLQLFNAESVELSGYAFAAIGAGAEGIAPLLGDYPGVLLSHDNSPGQCIVNGPSEVVQRLIETLRGDNVLCQKLPFRSAFHTPAFTAGLESIGAALRRWEIHEPTQPVWSATIAAPFPSDPAEVGALFARHMIEPVRFRPMIAAMYDAGLRVFLQVGAGQLASVIDDNLRGRDHLAIPVNVAHRSGLDQLRRVATALWVEGAEPQLAALDPRPGTAPVPGTASPQPTQAPRRGPKVRLDLGGPLVRLGEGARGLLDVAPSPPNGSGNGAPRVPASVPANGAVLAIDPSSAAPVKSPGPGPGRPAPAGSPASGNADPAMLAALDRLSTGSRAAAELAALLRDTARDAVSVLGAVAAPADTPTPARPAPARPTAVPPVGYRQTLRVSLQTMPYLAHHCFFVQPDDWPDPEDRWPVVPATAVVAHMMDAVAAAATGACVVGVRDARFHRWVIAAPPQEVELTVQAQAPGEFAVTFGGFARAIVEVAAGYPTDPPAPLRFDPATERQPTLPPARMYAERLMFHGPLFQGVTEVHALGDRHVRGVIVNPGPPGALLDNALQLIGNWLVSTQPFRTVALPVGLSRVRFFGPPPAAGTAFDCRARVRTIDEGHLTADAQLIRDGRMFAVIEGVLDRRFDSHPTARPAERFPERHPMSQRRPEGWTMAFDCWTDLVTRGMAARGILGGRGYADYERQPAAGRKQWLLGRIAVKDAVRFRQWEAGHTDVFPIELTVVNEEGGRPRVLLRPGRGLIECDVSLAHTAEIGVAIAKPREPSDRPDTPGVGIDVVEVVDRPSGTYQLSLSKVEQELLDSLAGTDADARRLWFARFWVAKEAAGKAEGTGLDGRPRDFVVTSAAPDELTVQVNGRRYRVESREVHNPQDLPARRYVVGWTWGPQPPPVAA